MTGPLPWPRNVDRLRVDAIRAFREIRRLRKQAACMGTMDRKGLDALLWQIETQAVIGELALEKARNGKDGD